jgi:hypothetical protein
VILTSPIRRRRIRAGTTLVSATLALAVFGAAACGGNGGSGEVTAEEFRQQADAICAEFESKLDAIEQPSSPDDLKRFVDEAVPIIEDGTQQLADLEPPEEFQEEWTRVVEINEENLETIRGVRTALEEDDLEEAQRLIEAGGDEEEADRLAREIGLTKCGQDTA